MIPNIAHPTKEEIIQYLQEKGYETRDDNSGQIRTNKCPFCPEQKIDWTHFYISYRGLHSCHKCGNSGNIVTLVRHFGDSLANARVNSRRDLDEEVKKPDEVKLEAPKKEPELDKDFQEKMQNSAEEYHKTLLMGFEKSEEGSQTNKILDYLTKDRGLSRETLEYFKIGWTGTAISIPLIENNKVVNIRFRKSPFDDNPSIPKILSTKGGKMTLFNVDCLKQEDNKVIITEGEIDAMSLYQQGWNRVISVTCGAQTFKEEWVEILKKEKSIYLCYDNDSAGQEGLKVAVERLGAGRCSRILLPEENNTVKDLNDFFAKAKKTIDDFTILYNKADKIKIDYAYIKDVKEAVKDTVELLKNPQKLRGLSTGYKDLDDLWKGMRNGDLIVISGDTNVGKSFFCQNIILNLTQQNKRCMLFSLEQPVEEMVERFMMLDSKLDYQGEVSVSESGAINLLVQAGTKLEQKPIYFYSGYDKLEPKLLGEVTDKAVRDFGCELVVIDHLHYFVIGDRKQRTTEIGDIVRYVKLLARKYNIPIILICHIRKLETDGKMPTMEDLKDSSAIKQDADIVAILYRERNTNRQLKDDFILNTDKNRHGQSGNKRFDIDKFCRVTESLNPVDGKDNTKAIDDDIKESEKETESNMKGINI
jgi:replicative DNA helicase